MDRHSVYYYVERGVQSVTLNNPAISGVLVDILKFKCNLKTIKHVSKWLQFLSEKSPNVCLSIYQSGGIPVLVELLTFPETSVSCHAVKTLHNLLLHQQDSRAAACKVGGLQKMVTLLKSSKEVSITVVDCLRILTYKNQKNKQVILSSGGTAELVRIIGTCSSIILLWTTTRVLKVLSTCPNNKSAIISAGGLQVFEKHLSTPVEKLLIDCLLTLRNLSDFACKEENVEPLLRKLIQLLRNGNKNIISYAAGILSNMTCNNPRNKVFICEEKGIRALVVALLIAGKQDEIVEPAIHTLLHLTWRHDKAVKAQNEVRLHNGLRPIVKLLNPPHACWSLIKDAIGLVKNLSSCSDNHEPLIELGADRLLSDILLSAYQDISKNRKPPSCYETHPTIVQGVKMEDIVEFILSALFNLSQNDKVMALLKEARISDTIFEIFTTENETTQRIATVIMQRIVLTTVIQSHISRLGW